MRRILRAWPRAKVGREASEGCQGAGRTSGIVRRSDRGRRNGLR